MMNYLVENEIVKEALLKKGLFIEDIYDLANTRKAYPEAISTLVQLLESKQVSNPITLEGLTRALAVKEAKGIANKLMLQMFKETEHEMLQWAIGNTINVIATKDDLDVIIKIVTNKKYGTSRQMPVMALGKFKLPKVEDALISLLDDEDVLAHTISSLAKHRSIKAKPIIERLLAHPQPLVRKEAKMALIKIDKK